MFPRGSCANDNHLSSVLDRLAVLDDLPDWLIREAPQRPVIGGFAKVSRVSLRKRDAALTLTFLAEAFLKSPTRSPG